MACYVGDDTKVRLNSAATPHKTSDLAILLNNCVMTILVFIVVLSLCFAMFSVIIPAQPPQPSPPGFLEIFVRYSIVLYCCLPMTLYVAFEFLHLVMGHFIEADDLMYDAPTKTYAKMRNTTVVEELGQVDFIFSDKTGTLTANEMRFAACCIGDRPLQSFLPLRSGEPGPGAFQAHDMLLSGEATTFFESLALCHTVKVDGQDFEAESPDEVALVEAARNAGMIYCHREVSNAVPNGFIYTIDGPQGKTEHTIGHILAFTSDRKRMSVVCPTSSGAEVITKGADNIMKDLIVGKELPSAAQESLERFSRQGLRTLVVARRTMSTNEYQDFKTKWEDANKVMEGRDQAIASVAASAEVEMAYVGVTALEDRLQDNVPETIKCVRDAGVRIWVLTGDKVETAVEIAKSCKLFEPDMELIEIVNQPDAAKHIVKVREALGWKRRYMIYSYPWQCAV
jgi:magnesium-transporting ATPase (P-type)